MDLETLLKLYFPKELPPTFTTDSFASVMHVYDTASPFSIKPSQKANLFRHEIPRHGLNRRIIGIPNPIFHYELCLEISSNWKAIEGIYRNSSISRSSPLFIENNSEEERNPLLHRLNTRASAAYILKTDISRCFASIYTHSIPWAIHTKLVAKNNRRPSALLGNKLDMLVRRGQDDQTIGIPIGPYTSVVISEIVLSAIDFELEKRVTSLRGTRYVDDFEFGFKTYHEAESCLTELNSILGTYELEINQLKTEIIKLPAQLEPKWVQQLRNFHLDNHQGDASSQKRRLLAYFDEVLTSLEVNSQEHVLNYALSKLNHITIFPENYKILQDFLFQCLMIDSSTFLRVLCLLQKIYTQDIEDGTDVFDHSTFEEILHHQLDFNCKLKRGHEVAWVLWAMMYWEYEIDDKNAKLLSSMDDSVIALMSLHAKDLGLIPKGLDTRLWEAHMNEAGLYSSQWLLAYEANVKGWLPKTSSPDYVAQDSNFGILKSADVQFYNIDNVIGFNLRKLLEQNIVRGGAYGSTIDDQNQARTQEKRKLYDLNNPFS